MSIKTISTIVTGTVGITPAWVFVNCDDDYTTVISEGFLNTYSSPINNINSRSFVVVAYGDESSTSEALFTPTISSNGTITLVPYPKKSLSSDNQFLNGFRTSYVSNQAYTLNKGQALDSTNAHLLELTEDTLQSFGDIGFNGLDTGEIEADKIYYTYVIGDSRTKNPNPTGGITSLSSTTPLLPEGYDIYRMVSVVCTDGDAQLYKYSCKGEGIDKIFQYSFSAQVLLLNAGTEITQTAIDLADKVPVNVKRVYINSNLACSSASENSAYIGLDGVDIADDGASVVLNGGGVSDVIFGTTDTYAGGATTHEFVATGVLTTDTIVASIKTATNAVALSGAVSLSDGHITATFSADPGTGTILTFAAQHATPVLSVLDYFEMTPTADLKIAYMLALAGATLTLGLGGFECCFSSGN